MKMPSKSCELDMLTTSLLKRVLDSCLPAIARVVNLLLDKGGFCTNGKQLSSILSNQIKKELVYPVTYMSAIFHLFARL